MSRSPQYAEAKRDLKASKQLNKSTGDIMRADLDNERAGRLRRAMSFKDTSRGAPTPGSDYSGTGSNQPKSSILDSMKSIYATLSKAALSKANKLSTISSKGTSPPVRPPRKPRSQSSMSDHHRSMSSLNTSRQDHRSMTSLNRPSAPQPASRTMIDGRHWDMHSTTSSTLPRSSRPTPTPRNGSQPRSSVSKTRLSISGASVRSSSMEPNNPHMVHGFRENRDPPKFERKRDNTNRFFGQPGSNMNDDSEVVERSRPPPDMRRFLLDNLNSTRNNKISNVASKQPSVIRAM